MRYEIKGKEILYLPPKAPLRARQQIMAIIIIPQTSLTKFMKTIN